MHKNLRDVTERADTFERKYKTSHQDTTKVDNLTKEYESKINEIKNTHSQEK